jgi:hypothetical protein
MPWTPRQTRFLLSTGSPLKPEQKDKMKAELHADPQLAHAKKGLLARARKRIAK